MGKIFNIAGPCNPAKHYMLPAMARLPNVMRLIEDKIGVPMVCERIRSNAALIPGAGDELIANYEIASMRCFAENG